MSPNAGLTVVVVCLRNVLLFTLTDAAAAATSEGLDEALTELFVHETVDDGVYAGGDVHEQSDQCDLNKWKK